MKGPRSGSTLFRFVYEDPVIALLIGCLAGGHLPAALALVLFFLHALFAAGAGMTAASIADMAAARRSFFDRPDDIRLHPISLDALAPRQLLKDVRFRPSFGRPISRNVFKLPVVPIRAFWVEVLRFPAPTEWRTYSGSLTTQFIFILERPSRLSSLNRFRLFHELQHASVAGVGATWQRYVLPRLAPVSVIGVLVTVGLENSLRSGYLLAILLGWFVWELSFARITRQLLAEVKADEFAVRHLPRSERTDVLHVCFALWRSANKPRAVPLRRRLEWHLRLARLTKAVEEENAMSGRHAASSDHLGLIKPSWSGRIGLAVLTGSILVFGPILNIGFFFFGLSVRPQSLTYLLVPAVAAIYQRVRARTLLLRAEKEFLSLEHLLIERRLVR